MVAASSSAKKSQPVLDPVEWRGFKLIAKDKLSHNTARYVPTIKDTTVSVSLVEAPG